MSFYDVYVGDLEVHRGSFEPVTVEGYVVVQVDIAAARVCSK